MKTREIDYYIRPERLAELFHEHGWTWASIGAPDEDAIRETVRRLLADCPDGGSSSTGRLMVDNEGGRNTDAGAVYLLVGRYEVTE